MLCLSIKKNVYAEFVLADCGGVVCGVVSRCAFDSAPGRQGSVSQRRNVFSGRCGSCRGVCGLVAAH